MMKKLTNRSSKPISFWTSEAPILVAHRGGDAAGMSKENTLAAFAAAAKLGYEYAETDVVLSSDGKVVAIHGSRNKLDSYLKKHRLPRSALQKMTYEEILKRVTVGGEKPPLLEDILRSQPKMRFFIDPKTDEVVESLAELLWRLKVLDRVAINSFSYARVQRFIKSLQPQKVSAGLIIGRGFRLTNKNLDMLKENKLKNINYVHLHHSHISKAMISLARSHKIKVLVWTANSPLSINNALKVGADGIISDNVELLKQLTVAKD